MLDLKVEGLAELEAQLKKLGDEVAFKALRTAARKAFLPILEDARRRVPRDSGLLADSLTLVTLNPKVTGGVVEVGLRVKVGKGGSRKDVKAAGRDIFILARTQGHGHVDSARAARAARRTQARKSAHWRWHFAEFGTKHQPAKPFLRPAMDAGAQAAIDTLKVELAKAINRAVKRQARKGAR